MAHVPALARAVRSARSTRPVGLLLVATLVVTGLAVAVPAAPADAVGGDPTIGSWAEACSTPGKTQQLFEKDERGEWLHDEVDRCAELEEVLGVLSAEMGETHTWAQRDRLLTFGRGEILATFYEVAMNSAPLAAGWFYDHAAGARHTVPGYWHFVWDSALDEIGEAVAAEWGRYEMLRCAYVPPAGQSWVGASECGTLIPGDPILTPRDAVRFGLQRWLNETVSDDDLLVLTEAYLALERRLATGGDATARGVSPRRDAALDAAAEIGRAAVGAAPSGDGRSGTSRADLVNRITDRLLLGVNVNALREDFPAEARFSRSRVLGWLFGYDAEPVMGDWRTSLLGMVYLVSKLNPAAAGNVAVALPTPPTEASFLLTQFGEAVPPARSVEFRGLPGGYLTAWRDGTWWVVRAGSGQPRLARELVFRSPGGAVLSAVWTGEEFRVTSLSGGTGSTGSDYLSMVASRYGGTGGAWTQLSLHEGLDVEATATVLDATRSTSEPLEDDETYAAGSTVEATLGFDSGTVTAPGGGQASWTLSRRVGSASVDERVEGPEASFAVRVLGNYTLRGAVDSAWGRLAEVAYRFTVGGDGTQVINDSDFTVTFTPRYTDASSTWRSGSVFPEDAPAIEICLSVTGRAPGDKRFTLDWPGTAAAAVVTSDTESTCFPWPGAASRKPGGYTIPEVSIADVALVGGVWVADEPFFLARPFLLGDSIMAPGRHGPFQYWISDVAPTADPIAYDASAGNAGTLWRTTSPSEVPTWMVGETEDYRIAADEPGTGTVLDFTIQWADGTVEVIEGHEPAWDDFRTVSHTWQARPSQEWRTAHGADVAAVVDISDRESDALVPVLLYGQVKRPEPRIEILGTQSARGVTTLNARVVDPAGIAASAIVLWNYTPQGFLDQETVPLRPGLVEVDGEERLQPSVLTATHSYPLKGTYPAAIGINYQDGSTSEAFEIVVPNSEPVVWLGGEPVVDARDVTLPVSVLDLDPADELALDVDWGGATAGARTSWTGLAGGDILSPAATYLADGSYEVTLTVTDSDGGVSTLARSVVVDTAPPAGPGEGDGGSGDPGDGDGGGPDDGDDGDSPPQVLALDDPVTGDLVVLDLSANAGCVIDRAAVSAELPPAPSGVALLTGLLDFDVSGCDTATALVTVRWHGLAGAPEPVAYKDLPDQPLTLATGQWRTVGGDVVYAVEYPLVDGGPLDADGAEDGRMSDPVGLFAAVEDGDAGGGGGGSGDGAGGGRGGDSVTGAAGQGGAGATARGSGAGLAGTGAESGPLGTLAGLLVVLGALLLAARRTGRTRRP